ncbi:hypothetical protein BD779DRAFT_1471827 [Infundibulicybe gibba]|nr:hypothetical protein BD779DRAFT_1471827 [Infundibulicybe gibba]
MGRVHPGENHLDGFHLGSQIQVARVQAQGTGVLDAEWMKSGESKAVGGAMGGLGVASPNMQAQNNLGLSSALSLSNHNFAPFFFFTHGPLPNPLVHSFIPLKMSIKTRNARRLQQEQSVHLPDYRAMAGIGPTPRTPAQVAADKATAASTKAAQHEAKINKLKSLAHLEDDLQKTQESQWLNAANPPTVYVQKAPRPVAKAWTHLGAQEQSIGGRLNSRAIGSKTPAVDGKALPPIAETSTTLTKNQRAAGLMQHPRFQRKKQGSPAAGDDIRDLGTDGTLQNEIQPDESVVPKKRLTVRQQVEAMRRVPVTPKPVIKTTAKPQQPDSTSKRKRRDTVSDQQLFDVNPGAASTITPKKAKKVPTHRTPSEQRLVTGNAPATKGGLRSQLMKPMKPVPNARIHQPAKEPAQVKTVKPIIDSTYGGIDDDLDEDAPVEVTLSETNTPEVSTKFQIKVEQGMATPLRKSRGTRSESERAPRKRPRNDHLPSNVRALWATKFLPTLRAYFSYLKADNPFVISDFPKIVKTVFRKVYPTLTGEFPDSRLGLKTPVYHLASQALCSARSSYRSAALDIVAAFFNSDAFPDSFSIEQFVNENVCLDSSYPLRYHWALYTSTKKSGSYENSLVFEVLAQAHIKQTLGIVKSWFPSEYPITAIALSLVALIVAQLERAFDLYRTGTFDETKNIQSAFSDDNWGVAAAGHITALRGKTPTKLQRIVDGAQAVAESIAGKKLAGQI